jgi:hypothetical protein
METGRGDVVISCKRFILFAILLVTRFILVVLARSLAEESEVFPRQVGLTLSLTSRLPQGQ